MLNTATCLISDVIGKHAESSAFVYGFYSFFDKIMNGVIIFLIASYLNKDPYALKLIMGILPVSCSNFRVLINVYWQSAIFRELARLSLSKH